MGSLSMRLLYSASSPYARIIRIALLETGLDARVTMQEVTRTKLYSVESEVLAFNPIGRVPTLLLDDGTILTESKLILDYIDSVNRGPRLLSRDGSDGWRTMAEMGQALGLLDAIVTWARALASPEPQHASAIIAQETARVRRAADALEVAVANGAYAGPMNAAQIVLGTALGLVEPRLPVWKWREGRTRLSAWYDAIAMRPSFQSTEPRPA
jgi:glutathione S-transferase